MRFAKRAALEYLEYDATLFRQATSIGGVAAARVLWSLGQRDRAFTLASRVHRSGGSALAARLVERTLRAHRGGADLQAFYAAHIRDSLHRSDTPPIAQKGLQLLGYRVLVVKGARARERGVIVLDYSYIFPLFAALFDIEAIARRYQIVLEPSWRGICTPDVLSYSRFDFPVLVESVEPRDVAFIKGLETNLSTVPVAANWWIDHRLIKPMPATTRDIDVIVVAAWSALKRHWRLFRELSRLRRKGRRLRVALVGYRLDMTKAEIQAEAQHFGVADQVELYEGLPLAEVGRLFARSKAHVLWSRKEGANRAIIEAMFADVPVVVRRGLSYGYEYPYINEQTGVFASEEELGDVLIDVIENRQRFHPREWALQNMSCQRATEILEEAVRETAAKLGESWTTGLTVKTSKLETQGYWNPDDGLQFERDYAFLAEQLRR